MVRPSADQLWQWLEEVSDPEIPVISVVELGIVRALDWLDDGSCAVTITPTYSGCPAMQLIAQEVEAVLRRHGVEKVQINTRLSPAWTTDWMRASGKEKLKSYGIAPPVQQVIDLSGISRRQALVQVDCPQCGSANTRLVSQFGSTACKALYRCAACLEPFDYFKTH